MSRSTLENNKRIAKNTLMLYFRMFLTMGISLFTSRVVLKTLGVEDFGIYNVVGGIVAMLGLIHGVMGGGTVRYLNIALGKEDDELAHKTFNVCFVIFVGIGIALFLLAETIGLWFLNNKMVIPDNRLFAANCVYQFTIFSAINKLLATPYNSLIIAHEKMSAFAYISILEVVLKLVIVYVLLVLPFDRLIVYGILLMSCEFMITCVYRFFCIRRYPESNLKFYSDWPFYKEMLSYSSWNLFGSAATLVKGQGLNILLNMFFNPSVNASRAIAYQINSAITQFSNNFYTAVKPQIFKYYAKEDLDNMFKLVFRSSKMSFFLIFFFSLPITIEAPCIIQLWLGQLPENVVIFVRFIVCISAVEGMAHPLMTTCHATGKIALYQSLVGSVTILNIPISYVFLKFNYPPVTVFVISLIIAILCLFIRLWLVKRLVNFPVFLYIKEIFGSVLLIIILAGCAPIFLHNLMPESYLRFIVVCCTCVISTTLFTYFIGLNAGEREFIKNTVAQKFKRRAV